MPLAPEFDVKLTLYYEVHNSAWFGGPGSVGYSSQSFDHVENPDHADMDFIKARLAEMATFLGVSADDIKVITYAQYAAATEDEDDEEDTFDD